MEVSAAETTETQVNGRFRPGASGDPAGRPKGAKNNTALLAEEAMEEKVGAVVDKLFERALAGSTGAIHQVLDRTMPVPRDCSRFELPDPCAPRGIADAQEALIIAVAAGEVPPRDANHEINRKIQAGEWSHPGMPFDETVPPPYVDMIVQALRERLRAARARLGDRPIARAAGFA